MVSISSPNSPLGPLLLLEKQRGRLRLSVVDGYLMAQLYVIQQDGGELIVSFSHSTLILPVDIDIEHLADVI